MAPAKPKWKLALGGETSHAGELQSIIQLVKSIQNNQREGPAGPHSIAQPDGPSGESDRKSQPGIFLDSPGSMEAAVETEKDQSVNVRSKQMKRTSTKQGLCCATLANPWLKIQIELTIVICWARCYHSGHKHSRHTWNGGYPFCILSKHIRITPTH